MALALLIARNAVCCVGTISTVSGSWEAAAGAAVLEAFWALGAFLFFLMSLIIIKKINFGHLGDLLKGLGVQLISALP